MRRLIPVIVIVAGCSKPPPPKPPPAELAVTGPASIAGDWILDDDMGWYHKLSVDKDGVVVGTIDRGKLAPCETKGSLATGKEERHFMVTYSKNTCHPEDQSVPLAFEVASFTGEVLTLVVTGKAGNERHTYHRKPKQ
jgi:hypothetical protein